jgi:prepilin-type N-terminal cleavage/methylation domain-containing protein
MMRCGKLQQYRQSIVSAAVSAYATNDTPPVAPSKTPLRRLSFSQRFRRGFTLIELMVVIAIIAILVALLFPAFARARYMARNVQCLTDKRSIVQGMILYAVDNKGRFPTGTSGCCYMNPKDQMQSIVQTIVTECGIPYGYWECAVTKPSLTARNDSIRPQVQPYNGYNKFYTGNNICYWVERGGSGTVASPRPWDNVWSSYTLDQQPSNVIFSDQFNMDGAGNVSGSHHYFAGAIARSNVACADGHAESRGPSEIRVRFAAWSFAY